jgi:hypothetical protein
MEVDWEICLEQEVAGVNLGDKRLNDRLGEVLLAFAKAPHLSIPAALGGRNETDAGYRLFGHANVTPEKILAVHFAKTRERVRQTPICLLVQDTTDVELTRPKQQVIGAGPMSSDNQFGAFLHPLVAIHPTGIPLGSLWEKHWTRRNRYQLEPEEKREKRRTTPIEEKESIRWVEGLRVARDVAEESPDTQCILVCDSESDIYELFAEPRHTSHGRPLETLVRGCHTRATTTEGVTIFDAVRATPCRYTAMVDVKSHTPKTPVETRKRKTERTPRTAQVEIRACSVILRAPERSDRRLPTVAINAILVEEVSPPPGEEPIQWLLLTTLPIDTEEQIRAAVDYYCGRWGIEVFFKTLKSGCRIEERQFEFLDRELNAIAVYMIVAWRVMALCRLGRECPDLSCEVLFETSEWKAVYLIVEKKPLPAKPPTLNQLIRMIAMLGGYVPRKSTEPGTQTLWIGLQRMHDLANCYDTCGPHAKNAREK